MACIHFMIMHLKISWNKKEYLTTNNITNAYRYIIFFSNHFFSDMDMIYEVAIKIIGYYIIETLTHVDSFSTLRYLMLNPVPKGQRTWRYSREARCPLWAYIPAQSFGVCMLTSLLPLPRIITAPLLFSSALLTPFLRWQRIRLILFSWKRSIVWNSN